MGIVKKYKEANEDDWKFVTYLVFDAPAQPGGYEKRIDYLKKVRSSSIHHHIVYNIIHFPESIQTIRSDSATSYAAVVGIRECLDVNHMKKYLSEVELAGGE